MATRFVPPAQQDPDVEPVDYPPPAQVAGVLLNAIFLDLVDQDARQLERINRLLGAGAGARDGLRPIRLELVRPSRDLGRLANDYEAELPRGLRFLTRGLGTQQTRSNDLLSLLMFQRDYVGTMLELGERDGAARIDELTALVDA